MKPAHETFISVDVEASGPIPGDYSLLSIGACHVNNPSERFYVELQPISEKIVAEALAVSGLSLEKLRQTGQPPAIAMQSFADWIEKKSTGAPVFVGFNAGFDWAFVNWYFHHFLNRNPFGISALDIKAFYMGRVGCKWAETSSKHLPPDLRPKVPLTHNALADAVTQGSIFRKLLEAAQNARE